MKIQPLGDRVLIEPLDKAEQEKTASGIVIPDTAEKDRLERGIILEVGGGARNEDGDIVPLLVNKGSKVLYSRPYGAEEIKIGDKKCVISKEEDRLAITEP